MEKEQTGSVQERVDFRVAQRAALYNTTTQKYCVAQMAFKDGLMNKKYGPWDLFGGHIDADEMIPEDAMRREIKEESGIDATELHTLSAIDFSGYGKKDKDMRRILIGYLALCDSEEVELSAEHDAYKWLTAQEIADHKEIKSWVKDFVAQSEQKLKEVDALGGWQRCMADFDNYKKRQAEAAKSSMQYATEDMAIKLLPVLDNFNASVEHVPAEHADSPWVMGLNYIKKQFEDALAEQGVTEMPLAIGDAFDPMKHEAIKENTNDANDASDESAEKANDESKESAQQTVAKIATRGYMIGDKVIRPARVVVK